MKEIILTYAPLFLMCVMTLINFIKITTTLKNVFKGNEIKQLKSELREIKSQLKEQTEVNKQLTNVVSKVTYYDKNAKM